MAEALLTLRDVSKDFVVGRSFFGKPTLLLSAVSNVNLDILEGETLGLVGESGSGKTTLGRLILQLLPTTSGRILFRDREISTFTSSELKDFRTEAQIVFQDPFSSFDPRMRIEEILAEGMPSHLNRSEKHDRTVEVLNMVGISSHFARRFPHQLSGGQRQRVAVARALAVDPKFIVLDEPVSALDVSVQAQILNLLRLLHQQLNLTFLLVAHDLRVVKHMSDRVAVMYLGQIMELGATAQVYENPLHPYTQALLSSIPAISKAEAERKQRIILSGEIPSPINVPPGCRFAGRCVNARPDCQDRPPQLTEVSEGHWVSCLSASSDAS